MLDTSAHMHMAYIGGYDALVQRQVRPQVARWWTMCPQGRSQTGLYLNMRTLDEAAREFRDA